MKDKDKLKVNAKMEIPKMRLLQKKYDKTFRNDELNKPWFNLFDWFN